MCHWQQKIERLQQQGLSLQVEKDGEILYQSAEPRLKPLFLCVRDRRTEMHDAIVIDKIVGKAAAYLCVLAKVKAVYTPIASQGAVDVLSVHAIELRTHRVVPMIMNQEKTGPCPMEQLADSCETAEMFFEKLGDRLNA